MNHRDTLLNIAGDVAQAASSMRKLAMAMLADDDPSDVLVIQRLLEASDAANKLRHGLIGIGDYIT